MQNKAWAFTLAEVLITLGIIGVVAALTIPILINNYQKAQYVTGLKKFYTNFNQALQKISTDNGCTNDLVCTNLFASGTNNATFGATLAPYFNISKNCGVTNTTNQDCWATVVNQKYDGLGTNSNLNNNTYYKFITTDGMSVFVTNYGNNCGYSWSNTGTGYMSQTCGYVDVDVNGFKGPNFYGRDIFEFWITNGKGAFLYPEGGADDKYFNVNRWWNGPTKTCTTDTTNRNATTCAGRVIEEGWEMSY